MPRILVIIEKGENSYGAYAPDVPGCVAVGDTREEVERLMKEALQEHLQMMREEHLPLPQSQTEAQNMDIPVLATWVIRSCINNTNQEIVTHAEDELAARFCLSRWPSYRILSSLF